MKILHSGVGLPLTAHDDIQFRAETVDSLVDNHQLFCNLFLQDLYRIKNSTISF